MTTTRSCKNCGAHFTPSTKQQQCCSRTCGNRLRSAKRTSATDRLCPCGSGLKARRTTLPYQPGFGLKCAQCAVTIPARAPETLKQYAAGDEQDRRNAAARRKLEEMREMREIGVAGG